MTDDRETSDIRSPAARAVLAGVVSIAVLVGAAFLVINRLHSSAANVVEHPGPAATDAQTQSEVVEQAKDIVAIAALQEPTAGYLLMSCKDHDNPPYQGAVYLDFQLPPDVSADQYFRTIAAAMVAHGWREGLPPNQHMFGRNLSKDGVNAILYPDRDSTTRGVGRIYGHCHDMNRLDSTDRCNTSIFGGVEWACWSVSRRSGCIGGRFPRRGGRPWPGARTGSGSGWLLRRGR